MAINIACVATASLENCSLSKYANKIVIITPLCVGDELMSSPSTSSIPSETDLFEITGVIILLIVGSCAFVLLWLILFLYFALLW